MNKDFVGQCGNQSGGALRLSQKVDYGLFLLAVLAKQEDQIPCSIQKIANDHGLSFSFLQKNAALLKRANLIKSKRGKSGGYILSKSANEISLKEIIEALEGPIRMMHCIDANPISHSSCKRAEFCSIRSGLMKINQEIQDSLLTKKLEHFIS